LPVAWLSADAIANHATVIKTFRLDQTTDRPDQMAAPKARGFRHIHSVPYAQLETFVSKN